MEISIEKFKEICNALTPSCVIYATVNQNKPKYLTACLDMQFDSVNIGSDFNNIVLRRNDGSGSMKFGCINKIIVEEKSILGSVFTIVCGRNATEERHTIIVR